MKSFKKLIKIHWSTSIYLIISFFTGYFKFYLGAYLIVLIHELCHFCMANSFHFQIKSIKLLPFGAYLSIEDFELHPINEELCVVLAGPCSHFFIYFLLLSFKKYVFIQYLLEMNRLIFIFNLLPIYPMDGYRCLLLVIEKVYDIQQSYYLTLKISILFLCLFLFICQRMNYYVIFLFLFYSNIIYFYHIPMILRKYFIHIPYDYSHKNKVIHKNIRYIKGKDNYYFIDNQLYDEKSMKYTLIKNIKRL